MTDEVRGDGLEIGLSQSASDNEHHRDDVTHASKLRLALAYKENKLYVLCLKW